MARLDEELTDDGIPLPDDTELRRRLLEELYVVRRPKVHERRRPLYGALVLPPGRSLLPVGDLSDLMDLTELGLEQARLFADGRSSFLARHSDGTIQLAYFTRSVQYEADLVDVQEATGALIVQRTLLTAGRLFTDEGVIEWTGHEWTFRPTAAAQLPVVGRTVPVASYDVLNGVLDLCVHWLSPGQVGATIVLVLSDGGELPEGFDCEASFDGAPLSVRVRQHFPAFLSVLSQTDLATVIDSKGTALRFAVGLRSSPEAERLVQDSRGMRHRSARRYSFDHPETLVFVVSEDGPVTVFSDGAAIAHAEAGVRRALARSVLPTQTVRCRRCDRLIEVVRNASATEAAHCPVCGWSEGFEETTVVGVVKEWQPDELPDTLSA